MNDRVDVLIVGGGIAGLAAAHRLQEAGGSSWLLVERDPTLGGKIATARHEGYVIEGGPDCFLGAKVAGIEFCRALGIEDRVIGTSPEFRRTYVKRSDRLYELPAGITGLVPSRLRPLMTTPILSLHGRLRAGFELFVPPRRDHVEESIADFVTRRFGEETYDWLVEPLLSGIFAGDGRLLSLPATFPQLIELERAHGSVIRMMLKGKGRNTSPGGANGPRPPMGFLTLRGGLAEMVETVTRGLPPEAVRLGVSAERMRPVDASFEVTLSDGQVLEATSVILAVPAFAAADLVEPFDSALAAPLREIPFVSTATVSVAFPTSDIPRPLDGYGFVSPRAEGGPIVACTWTSNKFPARVPEGGTLIRFFLGRAGNEAVAGSSDEEIRHVVRHELKQLHGITAEPAFWKIFRWSRGIPQYTIGHLDRLARIEAAVDQHMGLEMAGASYRGVGIPDCIDSGRAAADRSVARAMEVRS